MKFPKITLPIFLLVYMPSNTLASSCDGYPDGIGAVINATPNGPRIVSTARVSLSADYAYDIVDAFSEARVYAKSQISDFLRSKISKECKINTKKFSNSLISFELNEIEKKDVDFKKNKEILCNYIESTTSFLRGVSDIGRCYEPGEFVKVTIEIKPSTFLEVYEFNNYLKNKKINKGD